MSISNLSKVYLIRVAVTSERGCVTIDYAVEGLEFLNLSKGV